MSNAALVLIVILILLLVGVLPGWPHAQGWNAGYWPSGGVGLVLLIVLIVLLVR